MSFLSIGNRKIIFFAAVFVGITFLFAYNVEEPSLGATDQGKLFLAAATDLSNGKPISVTQRGPLYSVFLYLAGKIICDQTSPVVPAAREMGNIHRSLVASCYLEPAYLKLVLWLQVVLWLFTVLFAAIAIRMVRVSWLWIVILLPVFLIPSYWQMFGDIYDPVFTQFLIAGGVLLFAYSVKANFGAFPLFLSGIALSLTALSRPTFQLLVPFLCVLLIIPLAKKLSRRSFVTCLAGFLAPWIFLVGGWCLRNYERHHLIGVSSASGIALSTRTSLFLERAKAKFPDEIPVFLNIRNELLVSSSEHTGALWGDRAVQWLMNQRGLDYVAANKFLAKVNLAAILRAPQSYIFEVEKSIASFLLPDIPEISSVPILRLPLAALGFGIILIFLGISALWLSFHFLDRLRFFSKEPSWLDTDYLILFALGIFWYTVIISSMVDSGKQAHRAPVQFLIPLVIVLVVHRLELSVRVRKIFQR